MAKSKRKSEKRLTPRQIAFVGAYLQTLCASAAVHAAGYRMTRGAAEVEGSRLLRHPQVARAIAERLTARLRAADISVERTLEQLRRHAYWDPGCIWMVDPTTGARRLKYPDEMTVEERAGIAGWEAVRRNVEGGDGHQDQVIKVRQTDQLKALELLARYQGLLVERVEVDVGLSEALIQRLEAGRARVAAEAKKRIGEGSHG